MTSILERLFDGEINPGENSNPGTERFRNALRESEAARNALEITLSSEQKELLAIQSDTLRFLAMERRA